MHESSYCYWDSYSVRGGILQVLLFVFKLKNIIIHKYDFIKFAFFYLVGRGTVIYNTQ